MSTHLPFRDRVEAGRLLATELEKYRDADPVILALPRGGVVVGYEVAEYLRAPLDVIVVRKLGAPEQPELGIGAVAPAGVYLLDSAIINHLGLSQQEVDAILEREKGELSRRIKQYRGEEGLPEITGKTVILVDDGLATGITARAAIATLRTLEPLQIVLAVPVSARSAVVNVRNETDDFVCLAIPHPFRAVGLWYEEFTQVTDAEVIELLEEERGDVSFESISEPD